MASIPVICEPCGVVWFAPHFFGGNVHAIARGNRAAPCPSCGGYGIIPDGEYRPASITLLDPRHAAIVRDALAHIRDLMATNVSESEVHEIIDTHYPFLRPLKGFCQMSLADLYHLVFILVGLLTIYSQLSGPGEVEIKVPERAIDALEDIADSLNANPGSIPPAVP